MHGLVSTSAASQSASGHRARLRQRLLGAGAEAFQDYELVEYLLALTIPRVDTKPLAKRLIHDFGGIGPLLGVSADTLRREGLSDAAVAALKIAQATALRLLERRVEERPVLSGWQALCDYLHAAMAHSRTEQVRVLFLNAKNSLLANEAMWDGSVDEASVHVREVLARAIALGATALIIVHNHPSGDPTPSNQDIRLTRELVEAGKHMKVVVHDHVVEQPGADCHQGVVPVPAGGKGVDLGRIVDRDFRHPDAGGIGLPPLRHEGPRRQRAG